jgi:hypothetical protein
MQSPEESRGADYADLSALASAKADGAGTERLSFLGAVKSEM